MSFAIVGVPAPFDEGLVYRVPAEQEGLVRRGCRVLVPLSGRSVTGVVVELRESIPERFAGDAESIKAIVDLVDLEPVALADQIELAAFIASYYLAPLFDALRLMFPKDLPPRGNPIFGLSRIGAFFEPKTESEAQLHSKLLDKPQWRLSDLLQAGIEIPAGWMDDWVTRGLLAFPQSRSTEEIRAFELATGSLESHLSNVGRSRHGREVIALLASSARPMTAAEICGTLGCSAAVITRLARLGIIRRFQQLQGDRVRRHVLPAPILSAEPFELREEQQKALDEMRCNLAQNSYGCYLFEGLTGSGKTEVYLRLVAECLARGQGAIILVPEISLVPALAGQVRSRFGSAAAILHSNLSAKEREYEWNRIRSGEARLVLGPRSAIFAPLDSIGVVVVDEEHESAFKQESSPRYHGRDVAVFRGRRHGATVILASATPSLESRFNVTLGRYRPIRLKMRGGVGRLPEGILVDLRKEPTIRDSASAMVSTRLLHEMQVTLDAGDQIILLRNRRGYAPILTCRACGRSSECESCGLSLTLHAKRPRLCCHFCGEERPIPEICPFCREAALEPLGTGTERVEERLRELLPGIAMEVLDGEAVERPGGVVGILDRFSQQKTQILIGTQMVAKGHHFPKVALAAVLLADSYLAFPDFRAVERTYALLTQFAGRAGRGSRPGKVVVQTFHPDHFAVKAMLGNLDSAFWEEELRFRKAFEYPPFSRLASILSQDLDAGEARSSLDELCRLFALDPRIRKLRLQGPAPAPYERLRGKWRFQVLLRCPSGQVLRSLIRDTLELLPRPMRGRLTVDIDPQSLL